MVLQRWEPFREVRRMEDTIDRLWRGFGFRRVYEGVNGWALPLDVVHEDDNIVVRASIPGVKPEEINVTIEEGLLTVEGGSEVEREQQDGSYLRRERRTGRFHRALRLPDTLDTDKAETRYENGVLTITFPKLESKKAKRLEVKVGA